MNVLFLLRTLDPSSGGIQRVTHLVSKKLEEKGVNCFFAYKDESKNTVSQEKKIRLKLNHFQFPSETDFLAFIQKNSIDILINQDIYLYPLLKTYKKIKDQRICKIFNYFHLSPNFFLYDKRIHIRVLNLIFKAIFHKPYHVYSRSLMYDIADKYVFLSKTFKDDFKKLYGILNEEKMEFIPNPLTYPEIADASILEQKKKQVLILTRFNERQKNICSALRIWKKIEQKCPSCEWTLLLGGYGKDESVVLQYAKKLHLKNFKFLGKVVDSKKYYEDSSIFMMTSNFEGFGMTLTEAQQNGCIPMAFDTFPVLQDIIVSGENGFVVERGNESAYANKLCMLMNDPNLRRAMSNKCLDLVRKYDWDNLEPRWFALLEK